MHNDLAKLYNTLLLIETKGESTKVMAECLRFLEGLINKENEKQKGVSHDGGEQYGSRTRSTSDAS